MHFVGKEKIVAGQIVWKKLKEKLCVQVCNTCNDTLLVHFLLKFIGYKN